ncbi:MAG: hypothetical protein HYU97_11315 [Deltaproteobacteria bacterium]|nr:hypothetical protein [Deltaproteobacteria bacterium]
MKPSHVFFAALSTLWVSGWAQAETVIQRQFDPNKNGPWTVIDLGSTENNENSLDPKNMAVLPDGTVYLVAKTPLDGPPLGARILKIEDSSVTQVGNDISSDVDALYADETGIYVGTKGTSAQKESDIYQLNNATWALLNTESIQTEILSLASLDGVLYAGTNNDGIYRLDGQMLNRVGTTTIVLPEGYSWEILGDYTAELEKLAATSPNELVTIGKDHRVRQFNGSTWQDLGNLSETTYDADGVPLTTPLRELKSVALYNGTTYVGTKGKSGSSEGADKGAVWKWNGTGWDRLGTTIMNKEIKSLIVFSESDILAGSNESGVFQWNETTWTAKNSGLPATGGKIKAETLTLGDDGNLYVSQTNKLYRSTDHAGSWSEIGFFPFGEEIKSIATDSAGNVFVGTKLGAGAGMVFKLDGASFTAVGEELPKEARWLVVRSASDIFAALGGGGGAYHWNGSSWTSILGNITGDAADFKQLLILGTDFLAATKNGVQQGIFTTSITTIASPLLQKEIKSLWSNNGNLYAGLKLGGIFRLTDDASTDDGKGFIHVDTGLPDVETEGFALLDNEVVALGKKLLYTGAQSSDAIAFAPLGTNPGKAALDGDGNLIFSGETDFKTAIRYGGKLFAGTKDGLFISSNEGATWALFNGPAEVKKMVLVGTKLYVAVKGELTPDPEGDPTRKIKTASIFITDLSATSSELSDNLNNSTGGCMLTAYSPQSMESMTLALMVGFVLIFALRFRLSLLGRRKS